MCVLHYYTVFTFCKAARPTTLNLRLVTGIFSILKSWSKREYTISTCIRKKTLRQIAPSNPGSWRFELTKSGEWKGKEIDFSIVAIRHSQWTNDLIKKVQAPDGGFDEARLGRHGEDSSKIIS